MGTASSSKHHTDVLSSLLAIWKLLGWIRHSTPVFLPGESHGRRTLVGYSPRGRRVRHD